MQDFLQQSESLIGREMIKHSKLTKNGKEEELTRFFYIRGVLFEFNLKFWITASVGIPARSLL